MGRDLGRDQVARAMRAGAAAVVILSEVDAPPSLPEVSLALSLSLCVCVCVYMYIFIYINIYICLYIIYMLIYIYKQRS